MLTSVITKNGTQEEWKIVFWITAAVYIVGGIICMVLLEGTTEPWAERAIQIEVTEDSEVSDIKLNRSKRNHSQVVPL